MNLTYKVITESLNTGILKRSITKEIFNHIASKYNCATRVLSLGQDQRWKANLIKEMVKNRTVKHETVLDIACGTGDMIREWQRCDAGKIIGVDLTVPMLEHIKKNEIQPTAKLSCQDICCLGIKNISIDSITGGYALRNAPDLTAALTEIHRVLKDGGTCGILEFFKSHNRLIFYLQFAVLWLWGAFVGFVLHRNPWVYVYIAESMKRFPSDKDIINILQAHNFRVFECKKFYFGLIQIICFEKLPSKKHCMH